MKTPATLITFHLSPVPVKVGHEGREKGKRCRGSTKNLVSSGHCCGREELQTLPVCSLAKFFSRRLRSAFATSSESRPDLTCFSSSSCNTSFDETSSNLNPDRVNRRRRRRDNQICIMDYAGVYVQHSKGCGGKVQTSVATYSFKLKWCGACRLPSSLWRDSSAGFESPSTGNPDQLGRPRFDPSILQRRRIRHG